MQMTVFSDIVYSSLRQPTCIFEYYFQHWPIIHNKAIALA